MGFLDNVQSTFNRGVAAAGRTTDTVRLKAQMADALKRRQNLAAQLGANLYDLTRDDPTFRAGREALYDGIAAVDAERTQIQSALDRIEREAQAAQSAATSVPCPFCGAQLSATDVFCSGCGNPMTEIEAARNAAQQPAPAVSVDGPTCPACGSPMNVGDLFCMNCGHKLDAPASMPEPDPETEPSPDPELEAVSVPDPEAEAVPDPEPEPAPEAVTEPEPEPAPEAVTEPESESEPAPEPSLTFAFCPECGAHANPGDCFCMNCGHPLS